MPRVYRDASAELAAAVVSVGLAWLGRVMVIGGSARGRESVAMITPDETTATAIFKKKGEAKGGGEGKPLALAYVAVPRWRGERKEEVRYNLLERVSLVHEEAAEDHGHGQSCAMQFNDPALSTPKKSREGRGKANNDLPAERNTICIVGGTLNANTILFSSVPDAKVVTWSSHCVMGTWRGLNRSGKDDDDLSQVMKDGNC